jgi:hypothetical protein
VCISSDSVSAALWISAIKETAHVFQSVLFILQSSTNGNISFFHAQFAHARVSSFAAVTFCRVHFSDVDTMQCNNLLTCVITCQPAAR